MVLWIIQITIISLLLIFLVHYLINFLKSTLTVPKVKDLVNTPTQKYEDMFNIIKSSNTPTQEHTIIDLLPNNNTDEPTMKRELKNFLKKQLHDSSNTNNIEPSFLGLDSMSNIDTFLNY